MTDAHVAAAKVDHSVARVFEGLANLIAYSLGGDPLVANPSLAPVRSSPAARPRFRSRLPTARCATWSTPSAPAPSSTGRPRRGIASRRRCLPPRAARSTAARSGRWRCPRASASRCIRTCLRWRKPASRTALVTSRVPGFRGSGVMVRAPEPPNRFVLRGVLAIVAVRRCRPHHDCRGYPRRAGP